MFGLYLHIPFCVRKCGYCDFNSIPLKEGNLDAYVEALVLELSGFGRFNRRPVETLYVGGGTPTVMTEEHFTKIFAVVEDSFSLSSDFEVTVEANPGTLDDKKALHLLSLGVNRISLGVQSLRDHVLSRLGRLHNGAEALRTLEILRKTGFKNIGADLIYGLPEQSVKDWQEDLERIMKMHPQHLSLYSLSVEKGTPFASEQGLGKLNLPSEETVIEMYRRAIEETAAAGYEHYEISNYALSGFFSRHNSLYWAMGEYYGAGAGAHSFLREESPVRFHNDPDPAVYIRKIERQESAIVTREVLSRETYLSEAMMLGLRRTEGVKVKEFQRDYEVDPREYFSVQLSRSFEQGWLEETESTLSLTSKGTLFSNEVFMDLF
jgi:oxygen-independent coproporphyrinogen-3 oxidase